MIKKINASVMEIIVLHKFLHDEIEENMNSDRGYPAIVEALMIKNYKLLTPTMREIEKEKNELLETYGEKQPDGTFALNSSDTEKFQTFNQENNKLMIKIKNIKIRPIKMEYFERFPSLGFEVMRRLDFLTS